MKKIIITSIALSICFSAFAQFKATLKAGSRPNAVIVAVKSATTVTGVKFSSFQFAIGIPSAISPQPVTVDTTLNPAISYSAPTISTEIQDGVSYTVYSFIGDGAQNTAAARDFTAGQEYDYAEVRFENFPSTLSVDDTRLLQLPNGGNSGYVFFYAADRGTDVTDQVAQFYSPLTPNFSNDGNGYGGSSWAKYTGLVLPVKFLNFTVTKTNNTATLNWAVENEDANTATYEIFKSTNGTDFTSLATLPALNNGRSSNTYSFLVDKLSAIRSSGLVYFRIKQTDKDGKFVYTDIKNVRVDSKGLALYPNPVKTTTTLTFDLAENAAVTVSVIDAAGKQVSATRFQGFKGDNMRTVNMSNLSTGNYTLKVQSTLETRVISVVKAQN